jgi:hypothetical protein
VSSAGTGNTSTGNTVTNTATVTKTKTVTFGDTARVQLAKVGVSQSNTATGDNSGAATPGHVQTNGNVTVTVTFGAQS